MCFALERAPALTTYRTLDLVYGFAPIIPCGVVLLQSVYIVTFKAVLDLYWKSEMPINKDSRNYFVFLYQIRNS